MALHVRGWAAPGSVRGAFPQAWLCLNPPAGVQFNALVQGGLCGDCARHESWSLDA